MGSPGPRRLQELYLELGQAVGTLSQELGRSPTVDELAAATGASEEAVLEAMEAGQGYRATSIDVAGRQDQSLADTLADVDTGFADVDDRTVLVRRCDAFRPANGRSSICGSSRV